MSGRFTKAIGTLLSYVFALALNSSGYVMCFDANNSEDLKASHVHIHHVQADEHDHFHGANDEQEQHHHNDHRLSATAAIDTSAGHHIEFSILDRHVVDWKNHTQLECTLRTALAYTLDLSYVPLKDLSSFSNSHPMKIVPFNAHASKKTTVLIL